MQTLRLRQPVEAAQRFGAEVLLDTLVACGVDTIFGYPGGAALPLYDALHGEPRLRHILVRHKQAAVHAAEGYARNTGRVGVVLVTSGPCVSNAITGLLDAEDLRLRAKFGLTRLSNEGGGVGTSHGNEGCLCSGLRHLGDDE